MKKTSKKIIAFLLVSALATGTILSGCSSPSNSSSGGGTDSSQSADGVVTIKYPTFSVGTSVGAENHKEMMRLFNEAYGDKIKLEIEELPSDDAYTNKMKILAATKELPDVIDGKNGVRDLAVKNGQAMDFRPVLEADAQYAKEIGEPAIKAMTLEDGGVYSISSANVTVGYFYNTKMFSDAGIQPAKTWDEFMTNCDKLLEKGYTPLSLMTGENSWSTNLILASMVGTDGESGNKFMNTTYPETYQVPEMVRALTKMQTMLQKYTTEDAIGALYANAANNFCQEQTAIMANGLWMSGDFSNPEKSVEGLIDRIGFSAYPENGLISNYDIGYVICSTTDKTKEAAIELVKFLTNANAQKIKAEMMSVVPLTADVKLSEEFLAKDPFFAKLMEAKSNATYEYMNFDLSAHASVVDAFGKYYPDLAFNKMTPEEMTAKLDEAAAATK